MTLKKGIIPFALSLGLLLMTAGNAWATMTWWVTEGDPDYYMSDAIVVRNSSAEAATFDERVPEPFGLEWQDPIAGQTNYVWVRVWRFGVLSPPPNDTQTAKVRLFLGRSGTLFEASNYNIYDPDFNTNLLTPPESPIWDTDGWDDNLIDSAVVPVRYMVSPGNWSTEYVIDRDSNLPDQGGVIWLRFELEPYRLPSTASPEELPFSLVAYVFDPEYDITGDVTTNYAMAERRFNIANDGSGGGGGGCNTVGLKTGETLWTDILAMALLIGVVLVRRRRRVKVTL